MSEIGSGSGTSYPTAIDTDNTLEYNVSSASKTRARAEVVNDLADAIVAIETELGTSPSGTAATVKDFLIVQHNTDGSHKAITTNTLTATGQITSSLAIGTKPLVITSTTKCDNLNADLLDDMNSATTNTASTIVARDASGNFAAGTITATLTGNVTGDVTGNATTATTATNASGTGTAVKSPSNGILLIMASTSWSVGNIAPLGTVQKSVAMTGVVSGGRVCIGMPISASQFLVNGAVIHGYVSAVDQVTLVIHNVSTTNTLIAGGLNGTYTITVIQ